MKVISIHKIAGTEREVKCPNGGFISYRFLLASDKMGFSLHKTVIPVGKPQHWHYKHHLEACYCVSGWGVLKNLKTGREYMVQEDYVYVLDEHDDHTFQALQPTTLISIFNPPVHGLEVHDKDGSYRLMEDPNGKV